VIELSRQFMSLRTSSYSGKGLLEALPILQGLGDFLKFEKFSGQLGEVFPRLQRGRD